MSTTVPTAVSSAMPTATSEATSSIIDCADCTGPALGACDDCVVTFLLGREPDDALVIDVDEARVLRLLADAALVPALRHRRRSMPA